MANVGSIFDTIIGFLRKFCSIIIGLVMAIIVLLYVIGAGRVITLEGNAGKAGFAHLLGIFFSIASVVGYIILHFLPRKAYRLLYGLTGLLLLTMFLVGHSMGLAAPVVHDCNSLGLINYSSLSNTTWKDLGRISQILNNASNQTVIIGTLGEQVQHCGENELLFAAALIMLILHVVALFDVQKVLLNRVKSKTYGERFVEMGISN